MNTWLMEFIKDIRFLARKVRRCGKVYLKNAQFNSDTLPNNSIQTKNGKAAKYSNPLTSETMLTGQPAHYMGQNQHRMAQRRKSMGMGVYRQG